MNGSEPTDQYDRRPACARIAQGRGVCGTAAAQRATLVVPDVDSPKLNRFTNEDRAGLERLVSIIASHPSPAVTYS